MRFLFFILILFTQPLWGQSADEAFEQATEEAAAESAKEAQMREALNKAKKADSEDSEESSPSAAKDEEQLALPIEEEEAESMEKPEETPVKADGTSVKPDEAQATAEEPSEQKTEKEAPAPAPKKKKRKKSATAGTVKTSAPRRKIGIWQLGPRFMMWQEKIQAKESFSSYVYRGRFTAVAVGVSHKKSMGTSRRWLYDFNGDLILGSVKASSTVSGQTDELQSQSFYGLQLSPGLVYRSNNNTMLGLSAPFFFRQVDWKLSRPALQMDEKTAYDFGLGVNGQWRLRRDQFLKVGLTYRQSGALWTIAYDFTI